ncbi:uncharacterized protein LOC144159086 isoform X2 [Haemaphysalis longicornis]
MMASIPRVPTWSMAEACSGAVPAHVRFDRAEYSIQEIQATVPRAAIGIQCTLSFSVSEGSQTKKEFTVYHPEVSSGHVKEWPDADLTWSESSSTRDVGTSPDSGKDIAADLAAAQCTKNVETTPSTRVAHPEVGSGDEQERLDADLTWSKRLSTQDLEIVETSPDSDRNSDADLGAAQPRMTGKHHFSCHFCPYTSSYKSAVTRHIRTHTKKKPFRCDLCSRSFSRREHLTRHSATHAKEKRYNCEKCPAQGFISKAKLIQHMFSHTRKKFFRCKSCSLAFFFKSQLDTHTRIHTGEKPFKCEYCSLSFVRKSELVAHRRQHTGETPYVCTICSRKFTNRSSFAYHTSTHK